MPSATGPLRPGDPIGVSLLGGDREMGATGTITHIDGDRALRLRASVLQPRPDRVPDDARHVYASLPSLMSSFKIATMGEVIGTMQQDRATAIAGHARQGAGGDPDHDHARRRPHARQAHLHVHRVVNDQLFTPLLDLRRALQHARQLRAAVRRRDLHASRARRPSISTPTWRYEDIFTGDSTIAAAPRRTSPDRSRCCWRNDVEPVTVEGRRARRSRRPRVARGRRSSACGSTKSGRAPAARCRSRC